MFPQMPMLLLLLLSGSAAAAAPDVLYAVTGAKHHHISRIIKRGPATKVLYHKGQFAVVASNSSLPTDDGVVETELRDYDARKRYFVLQNKDKNRNATDDAAVAWASTIQQQNINISFLYRDSHYIVAMADPDNFAKLAEAGMDADEESDAIYDNLLLPKHTHYNPLTTKGLTTKQHANLQRLANVSDSVKNTGKRNPLIERMIQDVSPTRITEFVDTISNSWNTRVAMSSGANDAAILLREEFVSLGFETELDDYSEIYSPNVVAKKVGTVHPESWVVIGAHYDSRGRDRSSLTETAPGANDDGSGLAMLTELAQVIHDFEANFEYSLMIIAFSAEEQGLVGARSLAGRFSEGEEELDIIAMYAADMIGYRVPGRTLQVGLPIVGHTEALTALSATAFQLYLPEVQVCDYTGCCTDSQAFYDVGFPASRFFEACGALDDPQYHTPQDTNNREGYMDEEGLETLTSIIKGILATAFTLLVPMEE